VKLSDPVIYYRRSEMPEDELEMAQQYFRCTPFLADIKSGELVICRYSLLPFHRDIAEEVKLRGGRLINAPEMHEYVANVDRWYYDLEGLTPKTWFQLQDLPEEGPFVLKGQTNSRKDRWRYLMYAQDKPAAIQVASRLNDDVFISTQGTVIRQFVPLVNYGESISGVPVSKEFRFFCAYGEVLTGGFYWSTHSDELREAGTYPEVKEVPRGFLQEVLCRIGTNINFVVIDVAQTQAGEWIVIELNDGCMSGLSEVDPDVLYHLMYEVVTGERP